MVKERPESISMWLKVMPLNVPSTMKWLCSAGARLASAVNVGQFHAMCPKIWQEKHCGPRVEPNLVGHLYAGVTCSELSSGGVVSSGGTVGPWFPQLQVGRGLCSRRSLVCSSRGPSIISLIVPW